MFSLHSPSTQRALRFGALLLFISCAPSAFADLTFTCEETVNPIRLCPGATPFGSTLKDMFDETSPKGRFATVNAVLGLGDVVLCDGQAIANNTACDNKGISDILRFELFQNITTTSITLFSDLNNENTGEFGKPDAGPNNGSDVSNLTPIRPAIYITEAGLNNKGVERNIYKVINLRGDVATYTIVSDNPEPANITLVFIGLIAVGVRALVAKNGRSRRFFTLQSRI